MPIARSWARRLKAALPFQGGPAGARGNLGRATAGRRTANRNRPGLEPLEDRRLLSYAITNLGSLGGTFSIPLAINSRGAVVGVSYTANNAAEHAFLFSHGAIGDLGTLGGNSAEALGINDPGTVVGISTTAAGSNQPVIFLNKHGTMTTLGNLSTNPNTGGNVAINNRGDVVGFTLTNQDAALLRRGKLIDLGSLGGQGSGALALNNQGEVVGYSVKSGSGANTITHAFLYRRKKLIDLGTLGGSFAEADGINSRGTVVGVSALSNGYSHAFLISRGRMTDLGTLGGNSSASIGINDLGAVVGSATTASGAQHAFLDARGHMTDLNTLIPASSGFTLVSATAINNKGQIAVEAVSANAQDHTVYALLLTPTKRKR